jgi:hypothetical protein
MLVCRPRPRSDSSVADRGRCDALLAFHRLPRRQLGLGRQYLVPLAKDPPFTSLVVPPPAF